ncbi:phosphotransferase [Puniceibacterium antarcticum]|uniref:Phosphotransferase n=1 Tax=Puniceibacterium antarcticum TaxID=1206336 RepID=A0A2G8RIA0_9RHOB|nr:CehA/McbA family metallohydrolase [Puniceibacterium antarcticum]PIL20808.1 phosphotransferase [Puniceibacterium antarcticum]
MILPAFAAPGRFYRGNLHTHSTLSDGILPPAEVCRRYKAEGYDFIALTDHMIGIYGYPIADTLPFRDEAFTTLIGAELHSGPMQNGELWHILAVGLPADFAPANAPAFVPVAGQETGPELAQRAVDAGAFVAIAHPQWSGMTLDDARSLSAAHAVEIYNHGCAIGCDRPDGFQFADLLLSEGRCLTIVATDDAHFSEPDHFGGWVMVKSEALDPQSLLNALKAGHFYSSQGPQLHNVEVTDGTVIVESSAVAAVIVQGHGSAAQVRHGRSMTRTTLTLDRCATSPWLRITIVDTAGRRAWTNPLLRSTR